MVVKSSPRRAKTLAELEQSVMGVIGTRSASPLGSPRDSPRRFAALTSSAMRADAPIAHSTASTISSIIIRHDVRTGSQYRSPPPPPPPPVRSSRFGVDERRQPVVATRASRFD